MIRFIFLKDPSGCWVENGLGQSMHGSRKTREEAVAINQGRNAGGSDQGGKCGDGGLGIYF